MLYRDIYIVIEILNELYPDRGCWPCHPALHPCDHWEGTPTPQSSPLCEIWIRDLLAVRPAEGLDEKLLNGGTLACFPLFSHDGFQTGAGVNSHIQAKCQCLPTGPRVGFKEVSHSPGIEISPYHIVTTTQTLCMGYSAMWCKSVIEHLFTI